MCVDSDDENERDVFDEVENDACKVPRLENAEFAEPARRASPCMDSIRFVDTEDGRVDLVKGINCQATKYGFPANAWIIRRARGRSACIWSCA